MRSYGQFCPISRASEILAERWTPIILRNLLLGSNTFLEIAARAPGLSKTLLAKRLRELERAGVVEIEPKPDGHGSFYRPTQAGRELWRVLEAMGGWAQKWMEVTSDRADPDAVLWSWCSEFLRTDLLPAGRVVVRFEFPPSQPLHRRVLWLLVEDRTAEVCQKAPGFEEDLVVTVEDAAMFARWHLGLMEWDDALRSGGIRTSGRRSLARSLPTWNAAPDAHRARQNQEPGLGSGSDDEEPTRRSVRSGPALIEGFGGELITRDSDLYDEARALWNGAIDKHPSHIARCRTADDVRAVLSFAKSRELPLAVRGGGHGVGGTALCDDGVVADLSSMRRILVDPVSETVRAEAGVLWGQMDGAAHPFELATTGGIVSHTGIAGLTLGGGIGWLMRVHGLTIDNLLEVEMVTADGEQVVASEAENTDLFWGVRGGGGNFGIATSFTYQLHRIPARLLAGQVLWPMEDAEEVLSFYREFAAAAPREVNTVVFLRKAPPLPTLPPELHGRPVCAISMVHVGDPERAELALAPLRRFGRPLLDLVAFRSYLELQTMGDPTVPHGWHYYWKSADVDMLDEALIRTLVAHAGAATSPRSYTIVFQLGGAVSEVDEEATAYPGRSAAYAVNVNAVWLPEEDLAEAEMGWVRRFHQALSPFETGGYVNFLDQDDQHRVRSMYGPRKYQRLGALKDRYDPDNVFRLNHNIMPSTWVTSSRHGTAEPSPAPSSDLPAASAGRNPATGGAREDGIGR